MKLGRGPLRHSFQDSQRTAWIKPRSAPASRVLGTRERQTANSGLLPNQPVEMRMDARIEAATAAYLQALDDSEKATAWLYLQKAAQAADESWQQTVHGHNGPTVTNPTVSEIEQSGSASQDDDDSELDFSPHLKSRLNAPQLQAQLSRLSDTTRMRRLKDALHSKGAWQ